MSLKEREEYESGGVDEAILIVLVGVIVRIKSDTQQKIYLYYD